MDTIQLEIIDMDCTGCAVGIEMVTEKLDGVISAFIDLTGKCGTWEIDQSKVSVEDIISEIEKMGYKTKLILNKNK